MDADLVFAIVMLALVLVVSAVLSRRRTGSLTRSSLGGGALTFKDCYDLCRRNPKQASFGCATICAFGWP